MCLDAGQQRRQLEARAAAATEAGQQRVSLVEVPHDDDLVHPLRPTENRAYSSFASAVPWRVGRKVIEARGHVG